jgi:predicted MPP superfamily phosphohydrolase
MSHVTHLFDIRSIIILLFLLVTDLYAYQAFRSLTGDYSLTVKRTVKIFYLLVSILCFSVIILVETTDWENWNKVFRTYSFAFLIIIIFSKLILSIFVFIDDIVRFFRFSYRKLSALMTRKRTTMPERGTSPISRSDFLVKTGMFVAAIPFFSLVYGMAGNAYRYQMRKLSLRLPSLPQSFEGLRILQISDIHTGSFMSRRPLERAVSMINEEKPDIVFFTGDLVNNIHDEALPYTDILKGIKALHGVYSIFGNHDYGDYHTWEKPGDREKNIQELRNIHSELGWDLLWDEHRYIEKNGEKIGLIGVQNCSSRGFANYGSLEKATEGFNFCPVNILLSHDPSHWDKEVNKMYKKIDLTLSGHTHGMQFGVEIPGFKWSPVQYVYKEWAGMYRKDDQYLYVNRGLGFIGYPGRVGILPEITIIELTRKDYL